MKLARFLFPSGSFDQFADAVASCEQQGFHGAWVPQVFGWDALTTLVVAGTRSSRLQLGTAVIPAYPTHPLALAAAAMSAQAATGGRLTLGIGASHRFLVEESWGMSYAQPAQRMRDYLAALRPAMAGQPVEVRTCRLVARTPRPLELPGTPAPPVMLAALGDRMLAIAGELADGVITWLAGPDTVRSHILPKLRAAAEQAGRATPRLVVALPVCMTTDPVAARVRASQQFAPYTNVPSYRSVLDREGARDAAGVALIGDEDRICQQLAELSSYGTDEFAACPFGDPREIDQTVALLQSIAATPG
jgi:5,10-methylenetetrahydromethanopterin reductase